MNKYLKEGILWILNIIPLIYLVSIWNVLPEQVPTHFDLAGNVNGWSGKQDLVGIILFLGIGIYFLMLFVPKFDPKKKIEQMGEKYYSLRLLMGVFMALLSLYLLYVAKAGKINPFLLIGLIGGFYTMLGNYLQTVKPNYFIGIRTPWTLESEETWKKTHRLAGKLWMIGGLLIIAIAFLIKSNSILSTTFFVITLIITLVPVVYSYLEFRKIHSVK